MGGTYIPFPAVPDYPGVPQLNRATNTAVAAVPAISITLGSLQNVILDSLLQLPQWGIFDQFGNQLGVNPNSNTVLQSIGSQLLAQATGHLNAVLSTSSLEFTRETRVSDFPVELGSFASYNIVQIPANPTVVFTLQGDEDDRTAFLSAIDAACISTDLYNVVTPEYVYVNYNLERYRYARSSSRGATLLIVEVSLKEIRQVAATYATVTTPIQQPINPAATPQTNNGIVQPQTSILQQASQWLSRFNSTANR